MNRPLPPPPTAADMETMAFASIRALPEHFRDQLTDVVIKVEEFATREQLDSVGIESRWQLTGLYEGRPIDEQSLWDSGDLPPVITLFRQPLIREWRETGVDFAALIHHVTIHEAGHHFGLSDEDMHALEEAAEEN
ncbi:MAG: neutral zinc metallopeptidase [Erythrobacter sp. 34-65-8]|nr:MAG: neutral zinc metallopeptidase [Erythrobacter sp. 34-65-8]